MGDRDTCYYCFAKFDVSFNDILFEIRQPCKQPNCSFDILLQVGFVWT